MILIVILFLFASAHLLTTKWYLCYKTVLKNKSLKTVLFCYFNFFINAMRLG